MPIGSIPQCIVWSLMFIAYVLHVSYLHKKHDEEWLLPAYWVGGLVCFLWLFANLVVLVNKAIVGN